MKRNKLLTVVILILVAVMAIFAFTGCSGADNPVEGGGGNGSEITGDANQNDDELNTSNRKVVYNVFLSLKVKDTSATLKKIESVVKDGSYIVSSDVSDTTGTIKLKVKTEHLNDFVAAVSEGSTTVNKRITSEDVTDSYFDVESKIATLEAEKALLLADNEKNPEHVVINANRIAQIDNTIKNLKGDLNKYDKLVDFSSVTITLNKSGVTTGFWKDFGDTLYGALKVMMAIFKYILYVLIILVPFAAMGVGIFYLVKVIAKAHNKKMLRLQEERAKQLAKEREQRMVAQRMAVNVAPKNDNAKTEDAAAKANIGAGNKEYNYDPQTGKKISDAEKIQK